jgi:hypothetical protein
MTPKDLTILSRAQVDAFSDRVKDARARFELAKEIVPPGKEPEDVLNLLETRAWSITRQQFSAIGAWTPILGGRFLSDLYEGLTQIDEVRRVYLTRFDKEYRCDPEVQAGLLAVWSDTHAIGTRYVLSAMGDLAFADRMAENWSLPIGPTFPATNERVLSIAARGAWATARMGRPFLPTYKRALADPTAPLMLRFDAALAMTAIGLRHARHGDDARRSVAALGRETVGTASEFGRLITEACERALDAPEEATSEAAVFGASLLVSQGEAMPDGSPYKIARIEDVPRDLGLLVAANAFVDCLNPFTFSLLPWVATLERPDDLYYPADLAKAMSIDWTPELVEKVYGRQKGAAQEPVVQKGPRVGRNERCPCGSGKKYKRCCGG